MSDKSALSINTPKFTMYNTHFPRTPKTPTYPVHSDNYQQDKMKMKTTMTKKEEKRRKEKEEEEKKEDINSPSSNSSFLDDDFSTTPIITRNRAITTSKDFVGFSFGKLVRIFRNESKLVFFCVCVFYSVFFCWTPNFFFGFLAESNLMKNFKIK